VCSAKTRRLATRLILLYLLIAGAALAWSANQAVKNILDGISCSRKYKTVQQRFAHNYPNRPAMPDYAARMLTDMKQSRETVETVGRVLPSCIYSTLPLLSAVINQTEGTLYKLTLEQNFKGRPLLEFSMSVPADGRTGTAAGWVRGWQNNRTLAHQIAAITPTTTRRGYVADQEVSILSYKVTFKE
jgi:hypothetical protein